MTSPERIGGGGAVPRAAHSGDGKEIVGSEVGQHKAEEVGRERRRAQYRRMTRYLAADRIHQRKQSLAIS